MAYRMVCHMVCRIVCPLWNTSREGKVVLRTIRTGEEKPAAAGRTRAGRGGQPRRLRFPPDGSTGLTPPPSRITCCRPLTRRSSDEDKNCSFRIFCERAAAGAPGSPKGGELNCLPEFLP